MKSELKLLRNKIRVCTSCTLCETRNKAVIGSGDLAPKLLVLGEAPGASEDKEGIPFVGRAGEMLVKMLNVLSLNRDQVYITNTIKCRPPDNRLPTPYEISCCRPFLQEEINLIKPKAILAVGLTATKVLLSDEKAKLKDVRGLIKQSVLQIPFMATYHPAAILRSPALKEPAVEDLLVLNDYL